MCPERPVATPPCAPSGPLWALESAPKSLVNLFVPTDEQPSEGLSRPHQLPLRAAKVIISGGPARRTSPWAGLSYRCMGFSMITKFLLPNAGCGGPRAAAALGASWRPTSASAPSASTWRRWNHRHLWRACAPPPRRLGDKTSRRDETCFLPSFLLKLN